MKTNASTARSALSYFVLVFALAMPFWLFGGRFLPPLLSLPASALYVPAVLLAPAIYVWSYAVMRLLGLPLPDRVEFPQPKVRLGRGR